MSGLSLDGQQSSGVVNGGSSSSSSRAAAKSAKTLRFADQDLVREVPNGKAEKDFELDRWIGGGGGSRTSPNPKPRRPGAAHHDGSVERYFDNLITMIEDAAEGL